VHIVWANYFDGCRQADVFMDSHLSSLDQVSCSME
jgi:hypothetical protein